MNKRKLTLTINQEEHVVPARNADTLLAIIRSQLGLTGAKAGCLNGDCGACTIAVDGKPMKACLMFAFEGVGKEITTIEGLQDTTIQQAFIKSFAFQCGYCSPGFLMNAYLLIKQHPNPSDELIASYLASNLCRCTGYKEIEIAIKTALKQINKSS